MLPNWNIRYIIKPLIRWFEKPKGRKMDSIREDLQNQVNFLREIRSETGMTRKAFSEYMKIPLRNLEDWETGRRKMPDYLLKPGSTII